MLFGEEEFLIDEAYQVVYDSITNLGISDFDLDTLNGEETTPEHIANAASAFPMMGDMRVVIVHHFDKAVGGRRSKSAEKSPLGDYLRNPSPTTFLLLLLSSDSSATEELKGLSTSLSNAKQKDKTTAKIKKLKFPFNILIEQCEWIEFPKLYERQLPAWIAARFKKSGREISSDAADYIVAQVGSSLRDIANEVEKIITFAHDRKKINAEDVMSLVGDSREYNVFELQKAVGARELPKAMRILQHMMKAERNEVMIVSMLTRYFISLWKLLDVARTTTNSYEIAKQIGVFHFFVPEYLSVLNRYSPAEIERAFFSLKEADRRIKSTSDDSLILMQQMLIGIME